MGAWWAWQLICSPPVCWCLGFRRLSDLNLEEGQPLMKTLALDTREHLIAADRLSVKDNKYRFWWLPFTSMLSSLHKNSWSARAQRLLFVLLFRTIFLSLSLCITFAGFLQIRHVELNARLSMHSHCQRCMRVVVCSLRCMHEYCGEPARERVLIAAL